MKKQPITKTQNKLSNTKLAQTTGAAIVVTLTALTAGAFQTGLLKPVTISASVSRHSTGTASLSNIIYTSKDLVDTLPPNHPAWEAVEQLFAEIDALPEAAGNINYEWLREMRDHEDERLSRLYETGDWE